MLQLQEEEEVTTEGLFTLEEAAKYLGIGAPSLETYADNGTIEVIKKYMGKRKVEKYFTAEAVEAYDQRRKANLAKKTVPPPSRNGGRKSAKPPKKEEKGTPMDQQPTLSIPSTLQPMSPQEPPMMVPVVPITEVLTVVFPTKQQVMEQLSRLFKAVLDFQEQSGLPLGMDGWHVEPSPTSVHAWQVTLGEETLQVLEIDGQMQVISSLLVSTLQQDLKSALAQLHSTKKRLEGINKRSEEIVLPMDENYSRDLHVFFEKTIDGWLVRNSDLEFPVAAFGPTKDEGLANWKLTLRSIADRLYMESYTIDKESGEKKYVLLSPKRRSQLRELSLLFVDMDPVED